MKNFEGALSKQKLSLMVTINIYFNTIFVEVST